MRYLWKFVTAASDVRHFPPPALPEIAFLGRANVGKSSLINCLLGDKVAKTSSVPGRTRTINFFSVRRQGAANPEVVFADLPGYGYSKLSRVISSEWPNFINPYLRERPLALCVCLVDSNIPPQASDLQLVEFLKFARRNFLLVGTKTDRLSNHQWRITLDRFRHAFQTDRLLPFSSKTGSGREELWKEIRSAAARTAEGSGDPVIG